MTRVRYVALTPAHTIASAPAALLVHQDLIQCAIDLREVEESLVPLLQTCAVSRLNMLQPRNVPTLQPWGQVRFLCRDIPVPRRLPFRFTRSGAFIDLPDSEVSRRMANCLSFLGTDLLRWFYPPSPDLLWRVWY